MDTRDALLVDAFAREPMTGTPVGVVLEAAGLAADQRDRIAGEFGAPVCAFVASADDAWQLRVGGDPVNAEPLHVGLAVAKVLRERDRVAADAVTLHLPSRTLSVRLAEDARAWVSVAQPAVREASVTPAEAAAALGIDEAAIRDVAADFPLVRAAIGRGVLVVPVNFLEHLSGADPEPAAVGDVLEAASAETLYAFTFDTLSADRDAHGLAVDAAGRRLPPTGEAEAGAAAAIRRHGAIDHDLETVRFEAGELLGRPARLAVDTADGYAVGGRSVTVVDATVVVPPAAVDDVIEA